ncbi:Solute carrier family 15 member [Dirofilaria immitis]|nr:Solute carrier family 15 member [Dirofilaria immitis]
MNTGKRKGLLASLRAYPPSVFFMLGNEFCERFSFYGMRAILILYLITEHHFSESEASFFYHSFIAFAYLSPLFGSIAADNYFGRFRVILWMSAVYVIGHILLSVGAMPDLDQTFRLIFDFTGLAVIAFATGGIKPCVSAFAADQFDEKQINERNQFFSFFYFSVNAGSLLAILLTPILRGRVKCFNSEYCFPLAFGVPGVLMLLAFILFLAGWRYYQITPPAKGNIVFSVFCCICYAMREKICSIIRRHDKAEHWLDYAIPKYSNNFCVALKGSTWILQARRLDGRVGPFMILPDQMNVFNPLIVLITVPIFEAWIYPLVERIFKVTPLRKMSLGGCLAAIAFVMAGILQIEVNKTMEACPEHGRVILQAFGDSLHSYEINGTKLTDGKIDLPEGLYTVTSNSIENAQNFQMNLSSVASGKYLDIEPALTSSPEYMLKIGPGNCSVNDCPYNYTIYAKAGGAHTKYGQYALATTAIFVITIGEVLLSVTGLEFSYSQASSNMKSVLQAIWLMTVFLGNVIAMLISGSHIITEPATEFFVYAFLMIVVMGLFIMLAIRYNYISYVDDEDAQLKDIRKESSQENAIIESDNKL